MRVCIRRVHESQRLSYADSTSVSVDDAEPEGSVRTPESSESSPCRVRCALSPCDVREECRAVGCRFTRTEL